MWSLVVYLAKNKPKKNEDIQSLDFFNPFATGDAYMRQLFHCLQWYAGSERVNDYSVIFLISFLLKYAELLSFTSVYLLSSIPLG